MSSITDDSAPQFPLITRRKLLYIAGCATVAFVLPGCGGSSSGFQLGSGNGSIPLANFNGTVTLPTGVSASSLSVSAGGNNSSIKGNSFSFSAPNDAPCLITVLNPTSKQVVLFGLTYPGNGTTVVDNNSSAAALLFLSLGGDNYTRDGMTPLVDAILASSQVSTLATVVQTAQASDPYAIANGNAQIVAALQSAATSLAASINFGSPQNDLVPAPKDNLPVLLEIQPSDQVDGVTFINLTAITGFDVQNVKRRMGYIYTYTTGHVDQSGNQTPVNPPTEVGGVLEVPSTSSLLNLVSGWHPATSANVPLTLQGTDSKTDYTMVYLTQVYAGSTPAFFSDSQWAAEVPKWQATLSQLGANTFVAYITNVFLSVIGFGGLTWAGADLTAYAAEFSAIPSVAQVIELAAGDNQLLGECVKLCLQNFIEGDIAPQLLADMSKLATIASEQAGEALAAFAGTAAAISTLIAIISGLIASGVILLAGDLAAVAKDTSTGDRGDLWTATVVQQTISLNPQNPTANPGDTIAFTVNVPSGVQGTIEYTWSENALFGTLTDSNGVSGNPLNTSSPNVSLVTTGSDQSDITVTVVAYSVVNGTKTQIGTASTTVTMQSNSGSGGTFTLTIAGAPGSDSFYNGSYTQVCGGWVNGPETVGANKQGMAIETSTSNPNNENVYGFQLVVESGSNPPGGTYSFSPVDNANIPPPYFFFTLDAAKGGFFNPSGETGTCHISSDGNRYTFSFTVTSGADINGNVVTLTGSGWLYPDIHP